MQPKIILLASASLLGVALSGAALAEDTGKAARAKAAAQARPTTIQMKDLRGRSVGTVVMAPSGSGISFKLNLRNMPPGEHAITLHDVGICETPDFASVGDQVRAPVAVGAGELVELSGNISVNARGIGRSTVVLTDASLYDVLRADDGTALVIHAGREPAGDGDRIACGVIPAAPGQPSS